MFMPFARRRRPRSTRRASSRSNAWKTGPCSAPRSRTTRFAQAYTPPDNIYLEQNYFNTDSVSTSTDSDDYFKFYNLYGKSHLYAVARRHVVRRGPVRLRPEPQLAGQLDARRQRQRDDQRRPAGQPVLLRPGPRVLGGRPITACSSTTTTPGSSLEHRPRHRHELGPEQRQVLALQQDLLRGLPRLPRQRRLREVQHGGAGDGQPADEGLHLHGRPRRPDAAARLQRRRPDRHLGHGRRRAQSRPVSRSTPGRTTCGSPRSPAPTLTRSGSSATMPATRPAPRGTSAT